MSSVKIISLRLTLLSKLLWALAWGRRVHLVWVIVHPVMDIHPVDEMSSFLSDVPLFIQGDCKASRVWLCQRSGHSCVAAWGQEPSAPAHTRCSRGRWFWLPSQFSSGLEGQDLIWISFTLFITFCLRPQSGGEGNPWLPPLRSL